MAGIIGKIKKVTNASWWLYAAIGAVVAFMAIGFFANHIAVSIICSALIYLVMVVSPLPIAFGLFMLLIPNPAIFDTGGFLYTFNLAVILMALRLIYVAIIEKTLWNKATILFFGALILLGAYDLVNAVINGLFSFTYLSNLNIWVTWIIAYILLSHKEINVKAKILFFCLFAGYLLSFLFGLRYPFATWGTDWHPKFRFTGMMRDPNYYGVTSLLLVMTAPIMIKDWKKYIFMAVPALLAFVTFSKMYLVLAVPYVLAFFIYTLYFNPANKPNRLRNTLIVLIVVSLALIVGFASGILQNLLAKIIARFTDGGTGFDIDKITTGRTYLWREYIALLVGNPQSLILGRSFEYVDFYKVIYPEVQSMYLAAHNTYLDVILTFGLIGTAIYVFLWYSLLKAYGRREKSFYCIAAIVFFFIAIFGLSYLAADIFMVYVSFLLFLVKRERRMLEDRRLDIK